MGLKIVWHKGWAYVHGTGPDGKRIRRSLKTKDTRRAKEALAQLDAKLWRARVYGAEAAVTFEDAALAYANDGGETRFLVKVTERLTGKLLRDVTPNMIRQAAREAYPDAGPATLNRQAITPAAAVVNYGHAQGWCAPIRVKRFPVEKPERRAVGSEYLDKLRPHLPVNLYALMLFLHQTGRRVGDAIGLTPDRVKDGKAYIPKTKNGAEAWAHLTPALVDLLGQIEPRHGLVFGYLDRSSLYSTLRRACAKAGVPYLGTHQVGRHSFATALTKAGWSTKAVAEAGGWKTTRLVADVYDHPEDVQAKAARHFAKRKTVNKVAKPKPEASA